MAGRSQPLLLYVLLFSVFRASYNRHVGLSGPRPTGHTGDSEVDQFFANFQIPLPEGIDPNNVNITRIFIRDCRGMEERISMLNGQLEEATSYSHQLDQQVFVLRNDVRQLKQQLQTCSATATTTIASLRAQLTQKIDQLAEMSDNNTALTLKIASLTSDKNFLEAQIRSVTRPTDNTQLQRELEERTDELKIKTEELKRSHRNSQLILEIITLQTQLWDREQRQRQGVSSLEITRQIQDIQADLHQKLNELQGKGNVDTYTLLMLAVNNKITEIKRLIVVHIEQSKNQVTDLQKELKKMEELLKKKILQLSSDNNNNDLTYEILRVQMEVIRLRSLISNIKETANTRLTELRGNLTEQEGHQVELRIEMEKIDFTQAELIVTIITIMKEVREYQADGRGQTTVTEQMIYLETRLQAKERELAKSQDEVKDTKRRLEEKDEECSSLEEKYDKVTIELDEKIAELNRTGDSKTAVVLRIITLNTEMKGLIGEIAATGDQDKIAVLHRQLEEKRNELEAKARELNRVTSNPQIFFRIIQLQTDIWDAWRGPANATTSNRVEKLQTELDSLIDEIQGQGDKNTKLTLQIITLQSQVERLQEDLSDLRTSQTSQVVTNQLTNRLRSKEEELQTYIAELREKNENNANLTLTITALQYQLRKIQKETEAERRTSAARITKLEGQLMAKTEENSQNEAHIKDLKNRLSQKETQCSEIQDKHGRLQKNLDAKIKELEASADSIASLALQVSTLSAQVVALNQTTVKSEADLKELQKIIEEKNEQLANKTEELKARSAQPQRLLQIIAIQIRIDKLRNASGKGINYDMIAVLQDQINSLIDGIKNEENEDVKIIFQILAQQDAIATLRKKNTDETQANMDRIEELASDLADTKKQLNDKIAQLNRSATNVADLMNQILGLQKRAADLERELEDLKRTNAEKIAELEKQLKLKERQLEDSEELYRTSDAKNINLMMEVAGLRNQVKGHQKETFKANDKTVQEVNELKKQLTTQEQANRGQENQIKELEGELKEMTTCCNDANSRCSDVERELHDSLQDGDRLRRELLARDAAFNRVEQQYRESQGERHRLQDKYDSLEQVKTRLQVTVQDLQITQYHVEDKTIYPVNVVLDQNTANSRIILSADYTEMRVGTDAQNVPDHPGRYNVALAVLGKTGFSRGRRYWEVSVVGKSCYNLGVASESARRRGIIMVRPANGYWTLTKTKQGQFRALDRSPVSIEVQVSPATLGVLLDYKKGQISFYNAGSRSHIYSFVGQNFTDTLYPFIHDCTDSENNIPIIFTRAGSVDWIQ